MSIDSQALAFEYECSLHFGRCSLGAYRNRIYSLKYGKIETFVKNSLVGTITYGVVNCLF